MLAKNGTAFYGSWNNELGTPTPLEPMKEWPREEDVWGKILRASGKLKAVANLPEETDFEEPTNDLARFKDGSTAAKILTKAANLIDGDRDKSHGDRKECHTLIARFWTAYLGVQITPAEVAICMCLLKIARSKTGSFDLDHYTDLTGYGGLAGELAEGGC